MKTGGEERRRAFVCVCAFRPIVQLSCAEPSTADSAHLACSALLSQTFHLCGFIYSSLCSCRQSIPLAWETWICSLYRDATKKLRPGVRFIHIVSTSTLSGCPNIMPAWKWHVHIAEGKETQSLGNKWPKCHYKISINTCVNGISSGSKEREVACISSITTKWICQKNKLTSSDPGG